METVVCIFLHFCAVKVIPCSGSLWWTWWWWLWQVSRGTAPGAVGTAYVRREQELIPTLHVPGFHMGCQAARHRISASGGIVALSSGTKTADGEGDGSRGVTLPLQRGKQQALPQPCESA